MIYIDPNTGRSVQPRRRVRAERERAAVRMLLAFLAALIALGVKVLS